MYGRCSDNPFRFPVVAPAALALAVVPLPLPLPESSKIWKPPELAGAGAAATTEPKLSRLKLETEARTHSQRKSELMYGKTT